MRLDLGPYRQVIIFVGIRHSRHGLRSDLNNYARPQTSDILQIRKIMSALPLAPARLSKL